MLVWLNLRFLQHTLALVRLVLLRASLVLCTCCGCSRAYARGDSKRSPPNLFLYLMLYSKIKMWKTNKMWEKCYHHDTPLARLSSSKTKTGLVTIQDYPLPFSIHFLDRGPQKLNAETMREATYLIADPTLHQKCNTTLSTWGLSCQAANTTLLGIGPSGQALILGNAP